MRVYSKYTQKVFLRNLGLELRGFKQKQHVHYFCVLPYLPGITFFLDGGGLRLIRNSPITRGPTKTKKKKENNTSRTSTWKTSSARSCSCFGWSSCLTCASSASVMMSWCHIMHNNLQHEATNGDRIPAALNGTSVRLPLRKITQPKWISQFMNYDLACTAVYCTVHCWAEHCWIAVPLTAEHS